MADVHSSEIRSRNMAAIRCRDTKPEMRLRRLLHRAGYRYGLHDRTLPGKPDLVFRRTRRVIFVHGCFWHCHDCAFGRVQPKTNEAFWAKKRGENVKRDARNRKSLSAAGWKVLVVWECELRSTSGALARVRKFLGDSVRNGSPRAAPKARQSP